MSEDSSAGKVTLPAGVKVGAGIETSATDEQGIVQQGVRFPITTPGGTKTSVFIPYSELGNTAKVQQVIGDRVAAIMHIEG